MIRLTIAAPQDKAFEANQLALCLGYSLADGETFGPVLWQDEQGGRYALASGMVEESFLTKAFAPLAAPLWPVDMAAAGQAQSMVALYDPEAPLQVASDRILAICTEVDRAVNLIGLKPLETAL